MTGDDFKRKLTAILSADVAGYSRLMGEDESATVKTLETYKRVMFSLLKQHRGKVVDSPGDNLLAEFGSVVDAVQCAVSIQKELQIRNADLPENRRMEFRIGINLGDVIEEDGRIYGDGVNVAARLEALCDPGGICVSKTAFDQIESKLPLGYEYMGEQSVKNIPRPIGAYRVLMEPRITAAKGVEEKKTVPFLGKKPVLSTGIIVILAIVAVLYWNFYPHGPSTEPEPIEPEQEAVVSDVKEAPKTIAVLPFDDMSPQKDQEYFSDGLAEELLNKLSQVKDLHVTARTSSFYFKGKNVGLRTIGETLGVTYLLEGSVRKSENQLRITAQLIAVMDGYHLWSETYDRELKDIFTIQDDIAEAVTTALSVTLGVGEFSRPGITRNIEAYNEYLRATANYKKLTPDSMLTAIDQFKWALDIDPDFGLGWLYLWDAYTTVIKFLPPDETGVFKERAAEALKRARSIAPDMPELLLVTAYEYYKSGNWLEADHTYRQILDARGHANSRANRNYGAMLNLAGRNSDALTYLQRAKRLNPLQLGISTHLSLALFSLERIDEALVESRRGQTLEGFESDGDSNLIEVLVALEVNDKPRAAALINARYSLEDDYPDANMLRLAEILLMEDTDTALSELKKLSKSADISPATRTYLAHVASVLVDPELAFESLMESGHDGAPGAIWYPIHRAIWQLPAFKAYVRDIGLYDYWRSSGDWCDYCRPVDDDDFVCD